QHAHCDEREPVTSDYRAKNHSEHGGLRGKRIHLNSTLRAISLGDGRRMVDGPRRAPSRRKPMLRPANASGLMPQAGAARGGNLAAAFSRSHEEIFMTGVQQEARANKPKQM